jgi:U3 small nucleolar RNA-associated protein 19
MKKILSKTTTTANTESKTNTKSSTSSASQTATLIKNLLKQQSNTNNNIPAVTAEQNDAVRLDELRRIFSKLQSTSELCLAIGSSSTSSNKPNKPSKSSNVQEKWNTWLKKQHTAFISQLSTAVQESRKSSVRTFMGVIASSPIIDEHEHVKSERINPLLIQKLITALMQPTANTTNSIMAMGMSTSGEDGNDGIVPEYMLEMLDVEFIQKYRDVQYYILNSIKLIAQQLYKEVDAKQKLKKKQLKKNKKRKKDNGDNDDEEEDNQKIGIYAENLLRILLKIHLADDQSELNPTNVKASDGTCSNYLFLPPNHSPNSMDEESDDYDDENSDAGGDDDENNDQDNSDNEGEDDKNDKSKKRKTKLSPMQSIGQHRSALQEATLAILKLPNLPPRSLKLILQHFPSQILPNTTHPLRFADFCTNAYDMGGITSLLALNSLFILMTQCGLEYKKFYPSLYNLVEPKIFYAKYRTRFFKLLVKCLSSNQMLPAYIVAAFCKKLCRCALNAPPSGALFVLALISNLLRKHEECACIIHRTGGDDDGLINDVYDIDQLDPAKSRAIESSLWELNALEQHYHPSVSGMAKGCGMEDSKTLMHNLDEFLLHTYRSLFDQERKRAGNKRRDKLPLTFHEPEGLFKENDVFNGIFDFPSKKQKV